MNTGPETLHRLLGNIHVLGHLSRSVLEEKYLREAVGDGITFTQLNVLKMAVLPGRHFLGDVSRYLGVSFPAASKLVDRMEARRLLRRERYSGDRRAEVLKVTPRGRSVIRRYDRHRTLRLRKLFRNTEDAEARAAADTLESLLNVFLRGGELSSGACLRCGTLARTSCLLAEAGAECPYEEWRRASRPRAGGRVTSSPASIR